MSFLGFYPDLLILGVFGMGLSILLRKRIASLIRRIPLPPFLLYLLASLPLIVFEENINCLPSGCVLFPPTVPILLFFVLLLGIAVKIFHIRRMSVAVLLFSVGGILFEMAAGSSREQFLALTSFEKGFIVFWVGLSYAFLVLIPLTILIKGQKGK